MKAYANGLPETDNGVGVQVLAIVVPSPKCDRSLEVCRRTLECLRGQQFKTVVIISSSDQVGAERIEIPASDHVETRRSPIRIDDSVRNELCDEDDDIYIVDGATAASDWAAGTLATLSDIIAPFDVVPIVMNEDSDLSVELGKALGAIMFSKPMLVIAEADFVNANDDAALAELSDAIQSLDYRRLHTLSQSRRIGMPGTGAVMTAMIASGERMANVGVVTDFVVPTDQPGCVGAMFVRRNGH